MKLSIVIPVYNEEENLAPLLERINAVMSDREELYEILAVDDGSTDDSRKILKEQQQSHDPLRYVFLENNQGLSTALHAGFHRAKGDWIITLDADLQNPPEEIPKLLAYQGEFDLVYGKRMNRQDTILKKATSRVANTIRNLATGDSVTDTGCTLKLFRTEAVQSIPFFKGMHRFLPTLFYYHGYSRKEVSVEHDERHAGEAKYRFFNRAITIPDLFAVMWMRFRSIHYKIEDDSGSSNPRG